MDDDIRRYSFAYSSILWMVLISQIMDKGVTDVFILLPSAMEMEEVEKFDSNKLSDRAMYDRAHAKRKLKRPNPHQLHLEYFHNLEQKSS